MKYRFGSWCALTAALLFPAIHTIAADAPESTEAFLARARHPAAGSTYARLDGIIQHKKTGSGMVEYPAAFGIIIHPDRAHAVLRIDNRECYDLQQIRSSRTTADIAVTETGVKPGPPSIAAETGLNPADLTTGFLFYKLLKEEPESRVSTIPCRVLLLENPQTKEVVKAYLAKAYAFPLRAEFFASADAADGEPTRTLETRSFQKKNDLYYAELLNIRGRDWQTRVHFTKAELGIPNAATPDRIFPMLK